MRRVCVFLLASILASATALQAEELPAPLRLLSEWQNEPQGAALLQETRLLVAQLLEKPETIEPPGLEWPGAPTGVFLTAMQNRRVQACVGALYPSGQALGQALLRQAQRLLRDDHRHEPLTAHRFAEMRLVVSFTGAPRPVTDPSQVDIWHQGLVARHQSRAAVLLPGEAKTLAWGLSFLQKQLGVQHHDAMTFYQVPVVTFAEPQKESPSTLSTFR